jgi:hypothetical protein
MTKVNCQFITSCNYWLKQGYHNVAIHNVVVYRSLVVENVGFHHMHM